MGSERVFPKNRVCLDCGREFEKADIFGHADHMATHNPSGAQWANAYQMIQQGKDRAKKAERVQE